MKEYSKYITIDPQKRFGQPIIKNTRITVYDVLNWMANGMTIELIQSDFPELSIEQIRACLQYAADKDHKIAVIA